MATFTPGFKQLRDLCQGVDLLDSEHDLKALAALSSQRNKLQEGVAKELQQISAQAEQHGTDAHYQTIESFLDVVAAEPGQEAVAKRLQDTVKAPAIVQNPNQRKVNLRRLLTEPAVVRFVTNTLFKQGRTKNGTRDDKISTITNHGLNSYLEVAERRADQAAYDDTKRLVIRLIGLLFDLFNIASVQMGLQDDAPMENDNREARNRPQFIPMPGAH